MKDRGTALEDRAVFWGIVWGLAMGALWALFRLPDQVQKARQQVVEQGKALREQIQGDSVAQSLQEGKNLARR